MSLSDCPEIERMRDHIQTIECALCRADARAVMADRAEELGLVLEHALQRTLEADMRRDFSAAPAYRLSLRGCPQHRKLLEGKP